MRIFRALIATNLMDGLFPDGRDHEHSLKRDITTTRHV